MNKYKNKYELVLFYRFVISPAASAAIATSYPQDLIKAGSL